VTEPIDKLRKLSPEQRRQLREKLSRRLNAQNDEPACRPERISLYFFASSAGTSASEYYNMVMTAADRADRGGLHAIWVPERHFVDFGAYSPNPALLATAIAARTERVRVCAGSVVAPLQHPIRIAEDWALLDNLSAGRVGISFASGWHPQDFVLATDDYGQRRETMLRVIDRVRRLWRGEKIPHSTTAGGEVEVGIPLLPVQPSIPLWLTAAGNPDTFVAAARAGCGIMTALLGQTLAAVRKNIALYRQTWKDCGHPGEGDVVVMLHTYISDRPDLEDVVRPAMLEYLASFQTQQGQSYSPSELNIMLDEGFRNYFHGPVSLLGTRAKARSVLTTLAQMGVNEVGCLVDFGLAPELVLSGVGEIVTVTNEIPAVTNTFHGRTVS
jgi:natural product biosynthesis luciferase-like monooxygenase protein